MSIRESSFPNSFAFRMGKVSLCLILIGVWLYALRWTDSYFSVYILCAAAGITGVLTENLTGNDKGSEKKEKGTMIAAAVFSFLFSFSVLIAKYALFPAGIKGFLKGAAVFAGGFVLARFVFFLALRGIFLLKDGKRGKVLPAPAVLAFSMILIIIIDLIYFYGMTYPGVITNDTVWEITQFSTGELSNHHPFYHALLIRLCMWIGSLFSADINAQIAVYCYVQILFMAFAFGYAVMTLYETKLPVIFPVLALILYALTPAHVTYSVTVWKDVIFGGSLLLFSAGLFRVLKGMNYRSLNHVAYVLGTLGFALFRSNGFFALALLFLIMLFTLGKKRKTLLFITALIIVLSFIMKHPVLSILQVAQPEKVEMLSVPIQQISRTVVDDGNLSEEDLSDIARFHDPEKIREEYVPYISDHIKNLMRKQGYIEEHTDEYLKLWLRIGKKNPGTYVKAWIDLTRGYYNGGYEYWIISDYVVPNDIGLSQKEHVGWIQKAYEALAGPYYLSPVFQAFHSIGLHVWLTLLCLILMILKKRREYLLPAAQILLVLTLFISTPVFCEFRYVYALFTVFPFLFSITAFVCKEGALCDKIKQ